MTEKEYRKHPAINFSSLSWLIVGPAFYYKKKFKPVEEEDKSYFAVGGALDTLLTGGEKQFKEEYHILKNIRPKGKLGDFIEKYLFYTITKNIDQEIAFDLAYKDADYSISKERVKDYLDSQPYYKEKAKYMKDKRIIDAQEAKIVKAMYESIIKTPHAYKWFDTSNKDVEILMQHPIIFESCGVECKALLDILYIDHKNKVIYPVDLKTTGQNVMQFGSKFESYKYYLQASMYSDAVEYWKDNKKINGNRDFKDYKIENFRFLVVEKKERPLPLVFRCTDHDLYCGKYGGRIGKKYAKGYYELISDLNWHMQTGNWQVERDVYEAKFEIPLGIFNSDQHDQLVPSP